MAGLNSEAQMTLKVAVTGASGFVGRHVLKTLRAADVDVVAVTRTPQKLADQVDRVKVVQLDVGESDRNVFTLLGQPDVLIHLAWGGLPHYHSSHHYETELPQNYTFLRKMITSGLSHLVVAGTCLEYGMQAGKLSEEMICSPANSYAFAKHALGRQLTFLQSHITFSLTWARLFYTYGEGQADSSLWSQLNSALARNEQTFDMSGGEQLRDFLPIEKMARYLVALAFKRSDVGVINICSGKPISIRALVEEWIAESRKAIALNLGRYPYPDYEPMAFWGSAEKLHRTLEIE